MAHIKYFLVSLCLMGAQASSYYWPGKNGNILRTGFSEYGKIASTLTKKPAWTKLTKVVHRAGALIDDKKNIYITTIDGLLFKYSPDGDVLWRLDKRLPLQERLAENVLDAVAKSVFAGNGYLYNGTWFVAYHHGKSSAVLALDMESGAERWRTHEPVGSLDSWSLTAAEGMVFSGINEGGGQNDHLVAMSAETGDVHWKWTFYEPSYNSLQAVKDGTLVVSDQGGRAYRLNTTTGNVIWAKEGFNFTTSTGGTILGPNNVVYTTCNADDGQGWIIARAFEDGSEIWRSCTEYAANNAPAIAMINGRLTVVIGVGSNPDPAVQVPGQPFTIPDNSSFLTPKYQRVVAYDAETGKQLWRYELDLWYGWGAGETMSREGFCLPDAWSNAAIAGDGTVYAGNQDGNIYAVNDKNDDGEISADEVIKHHTGHSSQGSPALAPGMVVQSCCNGMYVFKGSEDVGSTVFM